jgi:hypothetical protein
MQMLARVPINVESPGEKDVERVKNAFEASRAVVKRRMFP